HRRARPRQDPWQHVREAHRRGPLGLQGACQRSQERPPLPLHPPLQEPCRRRGRHAGASALPVIPKRVKEEVDAAKIFHDLKERCIYCDIIRHETAAGVRLISETDRFTVLAPYAPRFPFETWILPKRHESHFEDADGSTVANLAWILRATIRKLEKVLEGPAYNFIVHSAPVQEGPLAHYHWHIEIIPRLTNVAGFEWATGFYVNPTPPEESAKFLREAGLG